VCGIAGFSGRHDRKTLEGMVESLHHRGPDESGYWEGNGISLGMRRLSIIDLDGGHQPMFNEDGTVAAVFNGEIYNHLELQKELVGEGHRFRSDHSDTETIVHLYEQHGLEFLHHLNGMFAIALWDDNRKQLVLARDRVGIKPLYFARTPDGVVFGSEIKALLRHPAVSRDPNFAALYHYLSLKNTPCPDTAYAAIGQLRPGEYAIVRGSSIETNTWWRVRFQEDPTISEQDAAARIRSLLQDSVRLQMRSDVPFGAYLSGGVDSSSVVALMARSTDRPVVTFSLTYTDDLAGKAEDQRFARMVSKAYGTDHHEYRLSGEEAVSNIDAVLEAFDEPFSGVTSTYFLTKLISRHVKVALSGDGADELFGSYLSHRLAQPLDFLLKLQRNGRAPAPEDAPALRPFEDRLDYLEGVLARGDEAARRLSLHLWDDAQKSALASDAFMGLLHHETTEQRVAAVFDGIDSPDPLNRALAYDFATLLPDQVLPFVDRLSMAHSVEVRPPFLDHRLVEFAATLPGSMKIKLGREKHILKEAMRGLIPEGILHRKKEGFVLPVDHWLLHELRATVEETLSPEHLDRHGLLRPQAIRRLLDDHYRGAAYHGARIWNLLMFQMWWERTYRAH
jgi:asparagine synthase (glutamine-hydrolysing)